MYLQLVVFHKFLDRRQTGHLNKDDSLCLCGKGAGFWAGIIPMVLFWWSPGTQVVNLRISVFFSFYVYINICIFVEIC